MTTNEPDTCRGHCICASCGGTFIHADVLIAKQEAEISTQSAHLATQKNARVTSLIRNALAENDQHGAGLDGMIQSLLAALEGRTAHTQLLEMESQQLQKMAIELRVHYIGAAKLLDTIQMSGVLDADTESAAIDAVADCERITGVSMNA